MNAENRKGGVTVQCKWLNSDMMLENLKLVACFQGTFQPAAISKLIALGHRYVEWVNGHQRASAEEGSLAISSGIVGETEKQRGRDVITVWGCRDRSLLSQAAAWCWTAVEGRTERERLTSCIPTHKNTLSSRRDKLLQKKKQPWTQHTDGVVLSLHIHTACCVSQPVCREVKHVLLLRPPHLRNGFSADAKLNENVFFF